MYWTDAAAGDQLIESQQQQQQQQCASAYNLNVNIIRLQEANDRRWRKRMSHAYTKFLASSAAASQ